MQRPQLSRCDIMCDMHQIMHRNINNRLVPSLPLNEGNSTTIVKATSGAQIKLQCAEATREMWVVGGDLRLCINCYNICTFTAAISGTITAACSSSYSGYGIVSTTIGSTTALFAACLDCASTSPTNVGSASYKGINCCNTSTFAAAINGTITAVCNACYSG